MFSLNLSNEYIMEMITKAFEKDDYFVEPKAYRYTDTEKKIMRIQFCSETLCQFSGKKNSHKNIIVFNSSRNGVNQYQNMERFIIARDSDFADIKDILEEVCSTQK